MGQAVEQLRGMDLDAQRLVTVLGCLRRRERSFWVITAAGLVAGSALSFVLPAIAAGVVASMSGQMGAEAMDWKLAFLYSSLAIIPLLYWLEWRTRGQFYMNELRSQCAGTDGKYDWGSLWRDPWRVRASAAEVATWIEIFLFAPRLTMSSVERFRTAVRLERPDLHRAARLLVQLGHHDRGVPVEDLLRTDDQPECFWPMAAYLRFHDWIDVASDGRTVWLLSEARGRLG